MPITAGERVPQVSLGLVTTDGVREVASGDFFEGRKVALFAVPGAFTPTCSETHLPGFLARADDLKAAGVDAVVCTAVNDIHVMAAWAREAGVGGHIEMLADGSGHLALGLGLELDGSRFGMGLRSRRYAAIVDDGVVEYLALEPGRGVTVSGAEALLRVLRGTAES